MVRCAGLAIKGGGQSHGHRLTFRSLALDGRPRTAREDVMAEHVLITGAGGPVGRSAMQHFAEKGVKTTAVSRRRPLHTYGAGFRSVDLADPRACAEGFGDLGDVTQLVFAAVHEEPDLVPGWTAQTHVERNAVMLRNTLEVVDRAAPTLRNVTILQGPKAYGVHVRPPRVAQREDRDETRDIPNFYWPQQDYLKARQAGRPWSWNVIRPALVIGMSANSSLSLISALGVYGAVLKERGRPLAWPGGAGGAMEATDTDLMADCFDWAAHSDAARNQTFNVTNGELFSLKEQWTVIAEAMGMSVGPDTPLSLTEVLPHWADEWDAIRAKCGLASGDLASFVGSSSQLADFVLARHVERPRPSAPMSTIKIRRAGFNETLYTDEMFRKWFARYQADRLLPPV
jgi:nucleoside-diphosphate-sugar epimerase